MGLPLLANRFARDRAGRLFDLASGRDITLVVGDRAADRRGAAGVVDWGRLDDNSPFAAIIDGPRAAAGEPGVADAWARTTAEAIDQSDTRLRELVVNARDTTAIRGIAVAIACEARVAGCVPVSLAGLRRLPSPAMLAGRSAAVVDLDGDRDRACAAVLALAALRARVVLVARAAGDERRQGTHVDGHLRENASAVVPQTARADRQLQSVRGESRRRLDVGRFLASTVTLADLRFARGQLAAAAKVAREARAWHGWWASSSNAPALPWLEEVAFLQELEQRVALERGRLIAVRPELETVLWFARVRAAGELEAAARASLARSFRLAGALDRACESLGREWPTHASVATQVRWGREALWAAMLARDAATAGHLARRLRASVDARHDRLARVVAEDLAALYHFLGDARARDQVLRDGVRGGIRLTGLEGARSRMLRASLDRSSPFSRGSPHLTMAMRSEQRQIRHALNPPDPAGRAPVSAAALRLPLDASVAGPEERALEGMLRLLAVCHADDDEVTAIGKACGLLREQLQATAVGVWTAASPQPLAAAGSGRVWPATLAERARAGGEPIGPEAHDLGVQVAWPVRFADVTVGAIACHWLPDSPVPGARVSVWLTAAASACAPLVRAWLDRAATPMVSDTFGIVGQSAAVRDLRAGIQRTANVPYHVLIEGESGSGKELVARAVHQASARRQKRFRAVNCAALTDELLEAELFGHAKGAFTGALVERAGLFEDACGGTLLLDEIADLSARGQAKVLRVLQDGEVRRVGENFSRRVDVRIVAATNKPLRHEAAAGRFREDLRYRLDVLRLTIPPLRERREDVALLAAHFWRDAASKVGSSAVLDGSVLAILTRYDWPGNVRELQNVIASLAVYAPARGRVPVSALGATLLPAGGPTGEVSLDEARRRFELDFVRGALARSGGRRTETARALGLSRQGLAKLMTRLGLEQA